VSFLRRAVLLGPLLLSIALISGRTGADPPGYTRDPAQASEQRTTYEEQSTGDFTLAVSRVFTDTTGARLLAIAEATYPPRERLVRLAVENRYEMGPDTAGARLWWAKGVGQARIPYAITAGAVEYFENLIDLYRRGAFQEAGTEPLFSARLLYRANATLRDTVTVGRTLFRGVYVTHQEFVWTYDDGTFDPMVVGRRVVVLTRDGKVLVIEGDGATRESVAISAHRGIGRSERKVH